MKIGIVGCGIGGMSAALFLARDGHDVTLFERFPEPQPLGAGLLIQPTGLAVLSELGLIDAVRGAGHRIDSLHGQTTDGTTIFDVRYSHLHRSLCGLGIHRGVLFDLLLGAVRRPEARLVTGLHVTATKLVGEQRLLFGADGGEIEGFDLVVDASGMNSAIRPTDVGVRATPFP